MNNKQILLVEDDQNLGDSLKKLLEKEGLQTHLARNLQEAEDKFKDEINLVVLDWMLPDGQGIDFLKNLRQRQILTPVIMLTARTELIDKVLGLEAGADDYVVKPFEPRELVARIRARLRVRPPLFSGQGEKIEAGELLIEVDKREIHYKGQLIEMTKMEFDLIRLLAENPERAFSREEILNKVWGYENYPSTRTVDTHVLQLRQKLDEGMIETIRGIGYRFRIPKES